MTLKTLSVRQPWSWAIAKGPKRIENRTWATTYRGQVAIHASLQWDKGGENSRVIQAAWAKFVADLPPMNCHHGPLRKTTLWMEFGAVIAVADLQDVCTVQGDHTACSCDSAWAVPFQCHWRLGNVRALAKPVPCKGALGLWTLPPGSAEAVRAQLAEEVRTS